MKMQKIMITVKFVLIGVVMTLGASMATAETYHVGVGQEYATIVEAYAQVPARGPGTIVIHEGVYTEFPSLFSSNNNSTDDVIFQRYGDDKVVLSLANKINNMRPDRNEFVGLIFDATRNKDGIVLEVKLVAKDIVFRECVFLGASDAGVFDNGKNDKNDNLLIENCTFINCGVGYKRASAPGSTMVLNCIFVDNTVAMTGSTDAELLTVGNSAFWNNGTDWANGTLGDGCLTDVEPLFVSTDIDDPYFMYLASNCPDSITKGGSDGSFMGARRMIPLAGTLLRIQ